MSASVFGREAELRTLGAFLDGLPRAPGALVLAGTAGAGKTTLLRAGAALASARGFTVLETIPAQSDLRLAFAGLSDLAGPCLPAVISELPAPQARALRVALLLEEAPPRPPEPREIAAAFRTALGALASSGPVLVVIDDVQWLDPASETAVGFAIRRLGHEPVGLICAQRTGQPGQELPLELGRARLRSDLLPVGGLNLGALHRMLRARLGISFSRSTLRRVEAESGGNPFIALEIGRALARRGVTTTGTAALPVPDTLSGLVEERLGEFPPAVLGGLQLVAVMPDAPMESYLAAGVTGPELDAGVLAGVLQLEQGRLRFAHPLLASAVAGSIPPARHRELHAAAARTARRPEEQARHWGLAATGPSETAAADLADAAGAAAARGAPATAAELFELAASLTPDENSAAASRRRLSAARQLYLAGDKRAAAELLEQLVASMPPGPGRADALSQLGAIRQDDDGVTATALLEQALAEAGHDHALRSDICASLADNWSKRGDQMRSLTEAHQAVLEAERINDPRRLATSLAQVVVRGFLCGAGLDERRLDRALELERALQADQDTGYLYLTPPSWVAGYCHLTEGRLDEAEQELRRVLAQADAAGIESWRADLLLRFSVIAGQRGQLMNAAELAAEGLDYAEQMGTPQHISALLYACARAALQRGQADTVRDLAQRGLALARQAGDLPYALYHQALPGSLDLALGNHAAAAARLGPLARQWRQMGARGVSPTSIEPDAVEALIAAGELGQADAILAQMERDAPNPFAASVTARGRGLLAAARGNLDAAVDDFSDALRLQRQISPMPLDRGRTLLALGAAQLRLRQRTTARTTLAEASAIFDRAGAALWAQRARAELARISGRAPDPGKLTATESRVAELVARGMSNRQIAAELFVTIRAVESTLTKTYAKLGIRSRTQLAARIRDLG